MLVQEMRGRSRLVGSMLGSFGRLVAIEVTKVSADPISVKQISTARDPENDF